jgi:hypothetical protein
MTMPTIACPVPGSGGGVTDRSANLIVDFYDELRDVAAEFDASYAATSEPRTWSPTFALPELTTRLRSFLSAATASWQTLGGYRGHSLTLLNLAGNSGTHTTKTFPSLLIVARAIRHIRETGEPIVLFTPTSANKGTALRDAVGRAIACGLVSPDELRVAVLAPATCADKLRADSLARDPELARRNPLMVLPGPEPEAVKALGARFVAEHGEALHRRTGARLWNSLALDNYLLADVARALFEHAVAPVDEAPLRRTHAHAVSSAFGMLGYHLGRDRLEATGRSSAGRRPHTLLVQHLGTPDMVLHLRFGDFERTALPEYRSTGRAGRYGQGSDLHFPFVTTSRDEVLDGTFYTHRPATAPRMSGIIRSFGGDGIVVSADECRGRYPMLRETLATAGFSAPEDPGRVREWSLVMAMTGVLNAIDRGLVASGHDVVVHASGWYTDEDYEGIGERTVAVNSTDDIARVLMGDHDDR